MCSPTLWIQAAGVGLAAYGSYTSSQARKGAMKYNADVAGIRADDAIRRGQQSAVAHRMQTRSLRAKQAVALAANGVALDSGSALDLLTSTDVLSEMDERTILENAQREAAGFQQQGVLSTYGARNESPLLSGAGTLLTSGGLVAEKWYDLRTSGAL